MDSPIKEITLAYLRQLKWVQHIIVQSAPQPGYWEQHGYDADAWIGNSNGFSA